jgi:hypothetical protein
MESCIKTREIGERFKMDGVLYEVAEAVTDDPCEGCSLQNEKGLVCRGDVGITGLCYDGMRSDNKQVIFKDVSKADKPKESLLNGDFTGETSEVWPLNEKLK